MNSMKCSDPHKKTLRQLLHGFERAQKADILAYSFGHLNHRNLYKVSEQHEGSALWQGAKKSTLKKEKNASKQQSSEIKAKKMTNAMVDFGQVTTVLPILPAANFPDDLDQNAVRVFQYMPDKTSRTCSATTEAKEQTLQDHFIKEELDLTALMLMKPQQQNCAQPHSSHGQSQFVECYLAGVTKEDQFRKLLEFEKRILMKQDLLDRDIMSGYKAVVKHEWKLAHELMKLGHLPVPNLKRLQIFSDVFEDICRHSTMFQEILSEIKVEYDVYLMSLLESQPKNQHKTFQAQFQIMENRLVKTHHVEEAHQRVLNLEKEAKLALQRNDELRNELEMELSKPKQQDVQPTVKPVKTKGHQLSDTEKMVSLRNRIYQTNAQIQELESELKNSMVPSTVTNAMQSSLRDSQALENYIERILNEHKVSKNVKENFWHMVNDLLDSAENKIAEVSG
ncbi:uncharacterized protein C6orf118-like isoform X2 [Pristis pectinata]|uniref:uncharacterized protein C6orf118-like isoform X2 n=1 Tax=Pristis pectinata TaxID=685728 RepID=UPI00223D1DF4|nr:uncharacterized protein C6orf118-like isoform X2 [Pristis pectinata]